MNNENNLKPMENKEARGENQCITLGTLETESSTETMAAITAQTEARNAKILSLPLPMQLRADDTLFNPTAEKVESDMLKLFDKTSPAYAQRLRNRFKKRDERRVKADVLVKSIMDGEMDHQYLLDGAETRKRICSFSPETAELIVSCAHVKTDAVINAIVSDPENTEEDVVARLLELRRGLMEPLYMYKAK